MAALCTPLNALSRTATPRGMPMKVADAMTCDVRTVLATDSVSLAMQIMRGVRVSGLPVLDSDGHLVGMVTAGDLLRRSEIGTERHRPRWLAKVLGPRRMAREYVESHSRHVGDLMTMPVLTIDEEAPLADAVQLLEKHHIKRLPVTHDGRLIGIISRTDLMRVLLGRLLAVSDPAARTWSDAEIQLHIAEEIHQQPWLACAAVQFSVSRGSVDIHGVVAHDAMRHALCVLLENVPGVSCVTDRLVVQRGRERRQGAARR